MILVDEHAGVLAGNEGLPEVNLVLYGTGGETVVEGHGNVVLEAGLVRSLVVLLGDLETGLVERPVIVDDTGLVDDTNGIDDGAVVAGGSPLKNIVEESIGTGLVSLGKPFDVGGVVTGRLVTVLGTRHGVEIEHNVHATRVTPLKHLVELRHVASGDVRLASKRWG